MTLPSNTPTVRRFVQQRGGEVFVFERTTTTGAGAASVVLPGADGPTEERLEGLLVRLKDPRPYFRDGGTAILRDPASYNERYIQDEMPLGRGFGGGYQRQQRSPGVTKNALTNKWRRPFAPLLTDPAFAELARGLALYALTGETRRPSDTGGSDGT